MANRLDSGSRQPVRRPTIPTRQPGIGSVNAGRPPRQPYQTTRETGAWGPVPPTVIRNLGSGILGGTNRRDGSGANLTRPVAPSNLPNPNNFLQAISTGAGIRPGGGGSSGGGGRGGSGGGGGGGTNSPALQAALQAALAGLTYNPQPFQTAMQNQIAALNTATQGQLAALSDAPINSRFDGLLGQLGAAYGEGTGRVQQALNELLGSASRTRGEVAGVFQSGDQGIENIGARYGASMGADQQALNGILSSFNAGTSEMSTQALMNMIAANRVSNQRSGSAFDAAFADRPTVYQGLSNDVTSGLARDQAGLTAQAEAQRMQQLAQMEAQRAQVQAQAAQQQAALQAQYELEMLREQQRIADQQNAIRLEAARAGIRL